MGRGRSFGNPSLNLSHPQGSTGTSQILPKKEKKNPKTLGIPQREFGKLLGNSRAFLCHSKPLSTEKERRKNKTKIKNSSTESQPPNPVGGHPKGTPPAQGTPLINTPVINCINYCNNSATPRALKGRERPAQRGIPGFWQLRAGNSQLGTRG